MSDCRCLNIIDASPEGHVSVCRDCNKVYDLSDGSDGSPTGRVADHMTVLCHPDLMTAREFVEDVRSHLGAFEANMNNIQGMGERYAEDWMVTLAAWMEMQK